MKTRRLLYGVLLVLVMFTHCLVVVAGPVGGGTTVIMAVAIMTTGFTGEDAAR